MAAETALVNILEADMTLNMLVGYRIYAQILPQNATLPAVVYTRVTSDQFYTLSGVTGLENATFQLSVWADTYSEVTEVRGSIKSLLDRHIGTYSGVEVVDTEIGVETDLYDETEVSYGRSIDCILYFRE